MVGIMGSKRRRSLDRIDHQREALKNFSDDHDELIKDMIDECNNASSDMICVNDSRILSSIRLPLTWQQVLYRNRMYMFLNSNDFYSINIPTNFYITNSNITSSIVDEEPPIIDWKIDMPSISLLHDFIKWSVIIYNRYHSEAAALLVYNNERNSWRIVYPNQVINGASVTIDMDNQSRLLLSEETVIVDLHSHHTMNIGFSSTDDHSDSILGAISHISIVLKNINSMDMLNYDRNFEVRLTVQGTSYPLKIEDVFTEDNSFDEIIESVVKVSNACNRIATRNIKHVITVPYKEREYD